MGVQVRPIKSVSLEAEFWGVQYSSDRYYDMIGRLKVMPFGPFFISGGYRYETLKIEQSGVNANIRVAGPFAEVGVTF